MSQIIIRSILETALNTITPKIPTQYENIVFTPTTNTPYQSAYLLMNTPDDIVLASGGMFREKGLFQVTLRFPLGNGTVTAMTQAEKIRNTFARGTVLEKDGHRLICDQTPSIRVLPNEVDRFVVAVKVSFMVDIFT